MAKQERGVITETTFFRKLFVFAWIIFSTIVYGISACIISIVRKPYALKIAQLWMRHFFKATGSKINVIGLEKLDKNARYVFIANHQSYFDIPALGTALPFYLGFIAKKELFQIPIFGWGMASAGMIQIDRNNARKARHSITQAVSQINKDNVSLVLFPEGTRSNDGEVKEFKRASFTVALEAGVPVVPVSIIGANLILAKRTMRFRKGTITIVIGDPISALEIATYDKNTLSSFIRDKVIAGMKTI